MSARQRNTRLPFMPYERKHERLVPFRHFLGRLATSLLLAGGIVGIALAIGIVGYHVVAHLSWVDAILNAAMILTGMGPVAVMNTTSSKLFASAYALFSGVVFLTAMGITLAPVFHRILHKFHLAEEDEAAPKARKA